MTHSGALPLDGDSVDVSNGGSVGKRRRNSSHSMEMHLGMFPLAYDMSGDSDDDSGDRGVGGHRSRISSRSMSCSPVSWMRPICRYVMKLHVALFVTN